MVKFLPNIGKFRSNLAKLMFKKMQIVEKKKTINGRVNTKKANFQKMNQKKRRFTPKMISHHLMDQPDLKICIEWVG